MSTETKPCLDCDSQISIRAKKCPYCLEWQAEKERRYKPGLSNLIAGLLSIAFPGLGYCYLGFRRDGLVAFVGISLFYLSAAKYGPSMFFIAYVVHGIIALTSFTMRDPVFADEDSERFKTRRNQR